MLRIRAPISIFGPCLTVATSSSGETRGQLPLCCCAASAGLSRFTQHRQTQLMPRVDFTDEEHAAIAAALRRLIEDDRFPFSPRLKPPKAALAKLAPPKPKLPPPLPIAGSSDGDPEEEEGEAVIYTWEPIRGGSGSTQRQKKHFVYAMSHLTISSGRDKPLTG